MNTKLTVISLVLIVVSVLIPQLYWFAKTFSFSLTNGYEESKIFRFNHGLWDGERAFKYVLKTCPTLPYTHKTNAIKYIPTESFDNTYSSFVNALTWYLFSKKITRSINVGIFVSKRHFVRHATCPGNKMSLCMFKYYPHETEKVCRKRIHRAIQTEKALHRTWGYADILKCFTTQLRVVSWSLHSKDLYISEQQQLKKGISHNVNLARTPRGWYIRSET
jgi:hypothetical protein